MHVLLTNDDGPPGPDSPFLLPFVNLLRQANPTWRISIVIPDCQKSWIGKGFDYRSKRIGTSYFHIPSRSIRSVPPPPGEEDNYMILLDTTPAACVNIALNHIHPDPIGKPKPAAATAGTSSSSATAGSSGPAVASASSTGKQKSTGATADDDDDDDFEEDDPIDLVLSGPNFGRNSSAASSTSSGTVGAAIEAALLGKRAIALSLAFFSRGDLTHPPSVQNACESAVRIVQTLWANWPTDSGDPPVDLFNVNIPLKPPPMAPVVVTRFQQGGYSSLYKVVDGSGGAEGGNGGGSAASAGGAAMATPSGPVYSFWPRFPREGPAEGTDSWAIFNGMSSVTPMKARYHSAEGTAAAEKISLALASIPHASL